jgi:GntR family transcriptional regulator / MocR family aminotransferase
MTRRLPRRPEINLSALVPLHVQGATPLYRQLYDGLRGAILHGQVQAGTRLPSTRALAQALQISRTTVLIAYQQLLAEGYLEGKWGSGTYIAHTLPEDLFATQTREAHPAVETHSDRRLASSAVLLTQTTQALASVLMPAADEHPAFVLGLPAVDAFPFSIWRRLLVRRYQRSASRLFRYQPPIGYQPLREAIAAYLGMTRGVRCTFEQVIVVVGSQQGLDLTARVLLRPGDSVWVENPGYLGARLAFLGAGAKLIPVPVDHEGLDIEAGLRRYGDAHLAYITPSHQFPLGAKMSLARRFALLDWANRVGSWIVEDDYDSEYRYVDRPLAALQGIDTTDRVLYLGTFSKSLFPALRLGYLVVPPDLVDHFVAARLCSDTHSAALEQAVLADFISEGHFSRHLRRMRTLYAERQTILLEAAQQEELAEVLEIIPDETGMHVVGWLPPGADDAEIARQAAIRYGLHCSPLSLFSLEPLPRAGLVLGYAAAGEPEIRTGVRQLASVIRSTLYDPPFGSTRPLNN